MRGAWTAGAADDDDDDEADGGHTATGMDMDVDIGGVGGPAEDFFTGDQAVDDDYGEGAGGDDFDDDNEGGGDRSMSAEGAQGPVRPSNTFVPFDPRRPPNQRNLVLAMANAEGEGENGMLDYFDAGVLQNWAGPQHWKIRRVAKRRMSFYAMIMQRTPLLIRFTSADNSEAAPKVKRDKKEPFKIDFDAPPEKDLKTLTKELFAPIARGTINLPGTSGRGKKALPEKKDDNCLPDDMHFSARQLVTLFLKPEFAVCYRLFLSKLLRS